MSTATRILIVIFLAQSAALAQSSAPQRIVKVFVQGDSSRLPDFVEECQHEFPNHGLKMQIVSFDAGFDFNIVIAQESSASGAAASVIALDGKGRFVASVVRSGRWSSKGALNAVAKELAKKLAVLSPR